jgi:hypothetical protein
VKAATASRTPSGPRPTQLRAVEDRADRVTARGPALAFVGIVVVAASGYAALAQLVPMPLVNPDELRYTLAARAVVDGEWLNLRDHGYGYGAVYPLVLSPILALSGSSGAVYPLFKLANALLFALTAVPIYLLARRLLSRWWSVLVVGMSLAIPSSIYTSLVMTESVAYLTSSIALLAIVLALERPSVARQLAMLGAVGLAYATRPQFAVLVPAFLVGWLMLWAVSPRRPRLPDAALRLWVVLGAVALAATAWVARLALTSWDTKDTLGGYGDLWRGYDLTAVARFAVYHLAGWELYLFVIPFAVAPVVVSDLLRAARRGGAREGAFVATFLTVNPLLLLVVAAFASTPYGYSELHDRYVFYLAPLWLVVFAVWLSQGLPRPLAWTAVGAGLALVLPAVLPYGLIGGNIVFEEVPTALWSWVWTVVHATPHVDGRRILASTSIVLTVAAVAVPRRFWPVLPALVVAGFVLMSVLAWKREVDAPAAFVTADDANRTWVDDALPNGARATKLYISPPSCPYTETMRHALFLTEFFNATVDRVVKIGDSRPDGLPADRVDIGPAGRLLRTDGKPLVAEFIVTQPQILLDGRRLARGTGADLVLWQTRGPVSLADARLRARDLAAQPCG